MNTNTQRHISAVKASALRGAARHARRAVVFSAATLLGVASHGVSAQTIDLGAARNFAILVLESGEMTLNSATKIVGNIGYSKNSVSTSNAKAEDFTGTAYVHSSATFEYTDKNFLPSGGVAIGGGSDSLLEQANADALALAATLDAFASTASLDSLTGSQSVDSVGPVNVVAVDNIDFNSNSLTLAGRPGKNDFFVIRVAGDVDFAQSSINLVHTTSSRVLFYFPNASTVKLFKAENEFRGTILAPEASVEYHNPALFEGAIIAKSINLHSYFNLTHEPLIVAEGRRTPPTGKLDLKRKVLLRGDKAKVGYEINR